MANTPSVPNLTSPPTVLRRPLQPQQQAAQAPLPGNLANLPQVYLGGNHPDTPGVGSGFAGIRTAPQKPGMSSSQAHKLLDKLRQQGDYRALPAQGLI